MIKIFFRANLLLIFVVFSCSATKAQSALSGKLLVGSYSFQQTENETENETSSFTPKLGALLAYEKYIKGRAHSVKLQQSVILHNGSELRTATQFLFRYRIYHRKHALSFGIGPSFFAKGMSEIDSEFSDAGTWQYRLQWWSGEVEYAYYINSQWRLAISANHAEPYSIALGVGLKFFMKSKAKSCNCPSFGKRR